MFSESSGQGPNTALEQVVAALDGHQLDPLKDFSIAGRIDMPELANGVLIAKGMN